MFKDVHVLGFFSLILTGGDIRYNMMTTSNLFREAQDEEMEHKVKKG